MRYPSAAFPTIVKVLSLLDFISCCSKKRKPQPFPSCVYSSTDLVHHKALHPLKVVGVVNAYKIFFSVFICSFGGHEANLYSKF